MKYKFLASAIVGDASLGERQIRVIANSGNADRVGDVLVAAGCRARQLPEKIRSFSMGTTRPSR